MSIACVRSSRFQSRYLAEVGVRVKEMDDRPNFLDQLAPFPFSLAVFGHLGSLLNSWVVIRNLFISLRKLSEIIGNCRKIAERSLICLK